MDIDTKALKTLKEGIYKWIFAILAFASLVFLVGIIITASILAAWHAVEKMLPVPIGVRPPRGALP